MTLPEIFTNIANAIRFKNGKQTQYKPAEMPAAIRALTRLQEKAVTIKANGNLTITPNSDYDGLSGVKVNVSVPEYNGALSIEKISITFTVDGVTYTTTAGDTWVSSGLVSIGLNNASLLYCESENGPVMTLASSNVLRNQGYKVQYGNTVIEDGEDYVTS